MNETSTEDPKLSTSQWLKSPKIPPLNAVIKLFHREIHRFPKKHFYSKRTWYHNVTPNFTVQRVQKPNCYLRKFSPDGRYLLAFSMNQLELEIYRYNGPAVAEDLLQNVKDESLLVDGAHRIYIEKCIFNRFFTLKHSVRVVQERQQLNRECSLFTNDGKFVIVGSAHTKLPSDYDDTYRNNESVTPNPRSPLDDYTIYVVSLEDGVLVDYVTFPHDKIFLAHNQGISLYEETIAVLSVQHQTVTVFRVQPDGSLVQIRKIGRVLYEDDDQILELGRPLDMRPPGVSSNRLPEGEKVLYSLKQRIMTFLYKQAARQCDEEGTRKPLLEYYKIFDVLFHYKIWKMQLLDSDHLLLKYASEEVVTLRAAEPNTQPSLFVIYNIKTTKIVGIYQNNSTDFLAAYENFADYFRNARLDCEAPYTSSPSNNYWCRQIHEKHKATLVVARGGGVRESTKRMLSQLPVSAQSFSASPYLDLDLFSYEDKWVSVMERPKNSSEAPIRFYSRDSGLLNFSLHAERNSRNGSGTSRRLVAFIFHPTDPFTISVQRANDEYVVSFHIRHVPNIDCHRESSNSTDESDV